MYLCASILSDAQDGLGVTSSKQKKKQFIENEELATPSKNLTEYCIYYKNLKNALNKLLACQLKF